MTHRQFVAWEEWYAKKVTAPDRADYYQMQTACEVRRVLRKDPSTVRLEHFVLNFPDGKAKQKPDRKTLIEKQLAHRRARLIKNGGFTDKQIQRILDDARERLEAADG